VEEALPDGEGEGGGDGSAGGGAPAAAAAALFPRRDAYPRASVNPFLNVLREAFKMSAAWDAMAQRCAEVGGGASNSSSSSSSGAGAERGGGCYATVIRARPDICMSAEENDAALPGGIDLDAWGRSAGAEEVLPPGAVASHALYTPQLNTSQAACSSDGAAGGGGGGGAKRLSIPQVHEIFGTDFGNCWGGPSDYFLFGKAAAMALVMTKAKVFDKLIMDYGVKCHPETLTRCAMLELARERTLRGAGEAHVVAHYALKLGFCRRWSQKTVCTGRSECVSLAAGMTAFWGVAVAGAGAWVRAPSPACGPQYCCGACGEAWTLA
jgi:hypothetical protein